MCASRHNVCHLLGEGMAAQGKVRSRGVVGMCSSCIGCRLASDRGSHAGVRIMPPPSPVSCALPPKAAPCAQPNNKAATMGEQAAICDYCNELCDPAHEYAFSLTCTFDKCGDNGKSLYHQV